MALRADDVDFVRDSSLVLRFQAGDQTAFDDLYRRYFSRLRRFCERRVGDRHEAEELAQEAFVRALRAMPEFAGERRFYPWMTVIAARLCVDSHRRRERSTPVADVDLGSVEADLDEVFAAVDREQLGRALGRLAPRHREVLDLRERQGWSYQRIADHYGVTLGTVEALLHRARRALRREFERVAGADARTRLVALPAVGWLARRVDGLRSRALPLTDLATPLSAAVASVAIAAGTVALGDAGRMAPPAHVASAERAAVAAPPAPDVPPDVPAPPAFVVSAGDATSAPAAAGPDPTRRSLAVGGSRVTDPDSARAYNASAPVHHDVGPVDVGLDPAAIVADALDALPGGSE